MKVFFRALANFTAGAITAFFIFSHFGFHQAENRSPENSHSNLHQWYAPTVPLKMEFAGEAVPLEKWDVKERFDRELLFNYYWQNNVLYMMKLGNRYFPIIEERLKANGVPADFKYICVAESNLLANAISKAGAVGYWQFLTGTASEYQLEVSDQVDMRRHIIESTDGACKFLKQAYDKFGSWTAAAASYNCGQGGYQQQATWQRTKNYYDLMLPEETNRYIFRALTFKYLLENAKELGFALDDDDFYQPLKTKTVFIDKPINNLTQFAIDNGTNYKTIKLLNPWLTSKSLNASPRKTYTILIPAVPD